MIADYNTMPRMFRECNRMYFNSTLPTPKYGLMNKLNTLARFEFNGNKKGNILSNGRRLNSLIAMTFLRMCFAT